MPDSTLDKPNAPATSLLEAVKTTLPKLPGFRSLELFGSHAEGRADAYSDIDGRVTTDDLPETKEQFPSLLESIGPVEFCWAINQRPDEWNLTVAFRDRSLYHRLDIGLADVAAPGLPIEDGGALLLIDQPAAPEPILRESSAYVPEYGSMGHFLLGQYLGCLRYLKARKRGQDMSCYRFAAAAMNWRLSLAYARLTENPSFRSKLSTEDYKKLDSLLSVCDCERLLSSLDFSSPAGMDSAVLAAAKGLFDDALHLAAMLGEPLPTPLFERIRAFLAEELEADSE